jgi:hypothetical protein
MTAKHKYENVQIKVKKRWQISTGDRQNRSATTCTFDNRPKRVRTRQSQQNFIMRDYYE